MWKQLTFPLMYIDLQNYFKNGGRAQWLMPVIPALWEAEVGRSRGQEFETRLTNIWNPISIKNTKPGVVTCTFNTSYSGGWGRRITWTWEAEVSVSRDCAIALQPGQLEWNSISKKKKFYFWKTAVCGKAEWDVIVFIMYIRNFQNPN